MRSIVCDQARRDSIANRHSVQSIDSQHRQLQHYTGCAKVDQFNSHPTNVKEWDNKNENQWDTGVRGVKPLKRVEYVRKRIITICVYSYLIVCMLLKMKMKNTINDNNLTLSLSPSLSHTWTFFAFCSIFCFRLTTSCCCFSSFVVVVLLLLKIRAL